VEGGKNDKNASPDKTRRHPLGAAGMATLGKVKRDRVRAGQDRTGQDRTGQDRKASLV
jgi:hypothetical protein